MESVSSSTTKLWGRARSVSTTSFLGCLLLLLTTPLLVFYFYIAAFYFDCALSAPLLAWLGGSLSMAMVPVPSPAAFVMVGCWLAFQAILAVIPDLLHKIFPSYQGGNIAGAVTPGGLQLRYNINGMQAWLISHLLFFVGWYLLGWYSPSIIFEEWGAILWIANILGFALALFAYVKAHLFPSYSADRTFSGSILYDFFMGIELNPRVGAIDLKLFFNGRPGIIAWTMINLSFAYAQYERYGYVTNSMLIVNLLQGLYVLYFFWKEAWYLKTIDIHHDHFGWMLAWGDSIWLPYMYTLQGLFLVFHPVELSTSYALFVLILGLVGFYIFASANNQKDSFRKGGNKAIWDKAPESISCRYQTADGTIRDSKLLVSGWWSIARHMNYTGDLMLSLAYSLACGVDYLFPYFYFFFLTTLLVHRCVRDEGRCSAKYGGSWQKYCQKVPYRIIPYLW